MNDQLIITLLLFVLLFFFVWGRWRYDAVALVFLSLFVLFGFIEPNNAFSGFAHPAVVTVALVLLISKGLEKSGFILIIENKIQKIAHNQTQFMVVLTLLAAVLSSFMNNIGAMAMLLPITLGICQKMSWNPSRFLMPLAFASILGGMNTKIGTPPNIIISEFRNDYVDQPFSFFDFSFIGLPLTIFGIIFISFLGWRLIALRPVNSLDNPLIKIDDYLTEMTIKPNSPLIDIRAQDFRSKLDTDTAVIGQIDSTEKKVELHGNFKLYEGQILILKINPSSLADLQQEYGLDVDSENELTKIKDLGSIEAIVTPKSRLIGRKNNYFKRLVGGGFSLLGLWRRGLKYRFRLANEKFRSGDVLLIANRGDKDSIAERLELAGLMPLWQRDFDIVRDSSKVLFAFLVFIFSLFLIIFNFLPILVAFLLCVIAFVGGRLLTGESVYRHIDWPVVTLLAAMIPIGNTLTEYKITSDFALFLASYSQSLDFVWMIIIIMIITMLLSDVINNAATAVIMGPLAASLAVQINQPVEPFLMAVAIGASCAFLSPIGHQCNTLVMGPGNYKFGDYWKMGLPLEILIIFVSVPLIVFYWA
jgi:di/tricarboxylate transporter